MDKLIKKILVEWSYRLDDGMIDLCDGNSLIHHFVYKGFPNQKI